MRFFRKRERIIPVCPSQDKSVVLALKKERYEDERLERSIRRDVLLSLIHICFISPEVVGEVENQNLHALEQKDMIIIAAKAFQTQAERLEMCIRDRIENIYDYAHVAGDDTYRAAFAAASVCGLDSIAIDGDTIG